jgi:hypothetical protein
MKAEWINVGPTQRPYCEIATDDSGMVYLSVQSGATRTSDYLDVDDAERLGRAILAAVARARGAAGGQVGGDK